MIELKKFDATLGLNRGRSKLIEVCWYFVKIVFLNQKCVIEGFIP